MMELFSFFLIRFPCVSFQSTSVRYHDENFLICQTILSKMLTSIASIAGVSLGPFADYNSRLFSGSAAELFEFANQDSEVQRRYQSSLRVALKYGVRVSFIGSIDDQLVSLEVSTLPFMAAVQPCY